MEDLIRHAKITIKDSRAKIEQIVASCHSCQLTNATAHGSNPGTWLRGDRPGAYWEVLPGFKEYAMLSPDQVFIFFILT